MRRMSALLVVVVMVLGFTACSDDEGTTVSAVSLLSGAPEKTIETGSSHFSLEATVELPQGTMRMAGDGEQNFDPAAVQMEMNLSGIPEAEGQVIEMILVGRTMFMGGSVFGPALPAGKEWVSIDFATIAEESGVDLGQLAGTQNDPTQMLAFLKGASDDVEEVGTEEVRGVETTHYRATIDLDKAAAQAKGITDEDAFKRAIEQFGVETIPVDVWIDDDGLPRRHSMKMPVAGADSADIVMEFFDFGADVDVEAPPADEVVDVKQLLQNRQAGA